MVLAGDSVHTPANFVDDMTEASERKASCETASTDLRVIWIRVLPSGNFTIFHIAIENDPVEIVDLPIENGDVP